MSSWPTAVLFDFDGVIVNSEPLHFAAFRQVLAGENISITEEEYYRDLIGFDDRGAFGYLFAKHERNVDAKVFAEVMSRKAQTMLGMIAGGEFTALPGTAELVRGLSKHYPLAICSGALRHEIESMLEGIKLRECFPIIVAAEDVLLGKPNPEGYLKTVRLVGERMGVKLAPKDCLIIEDAPSVIRSVKKEGFLTLGVATSYPLEALNEATYVVSQLTPAEVLGQIPQLKIGG